MMGKENRYDIALFLLKFVSRRCNSTFILSSPTINIAMRPPITRLCKVVMASALLVSHFMVFIGWLFIVATCSLFLIQEIPWLMYWMLHLNRSEAFSNLELAPKFAIISCSIHNINKCIGKALC